jgi:hypothetical protein
MDPQVLAQKPEFVWRRFLETPPPWSLALPVGFALAIVVLVGLFRREHRMRGMAVPLTVVGIASAIYVVAGVRIFLSAFSWWYLLVPTLATALVYVALMYLKDARSVHPAIAGFLGLLRALVYAILAAVFLLPGCQTFEMSEYHAKSLFLFDVSGSMVATVDDLPEIGQDPATLPKRQDKVIRFLSQGNKDTKPFLELALPKTPIAAYRFGTRLDESDIQLWKDGQAPSLEALNSWLRPNKNQFKAPDNMPQEEIDKLRGKHEDLVDALLSGTNIGGAALQLAKLEGNSYLQAVIVASDGQNNLGSEDALREFANRMAAGKKKVPIFTIGVGEYQLPASIRIDDLQAPETARPDDKFPVRVPVLGRGLGEEEFNVTLEATRIKDGLGQPVVGERTYSLGPKRGKFQGGGDYPQDVVEFEIDVQELKAIKAGDESDGDLEGTWQFVAKVPRHPREPFAKAEHLSEPATDVLVQKRKMRVLLFAGGPTREYQFLRTLLYREVTEKRLDLSVLLQTGHEDHVDQDVEPDRFLSGFPSKLGAAEVGEKYMSLSDYDVIIAIDPDWQALEPSQYKLVKEWVGAHSGGIVFIAGPVHSFQLARDALKDMSDLKTLLPVALDDSRLHGLGGIGHDTTRPYVLNFTPAARLFDFLKLDEAEEAPTAGWDKFFWEGGQRPGNIRDEKPKRGFYNYYPVSKLKADSSVIATFVGPDSSRINDGKDEQPFMVAMRYGNGKSLYIGSAETWRLRHAKDAYHERFWIKMCRYMSSGTTQQKRYGRWLLPRTVSVGNVAMEAQLKGADLLPLPNDMHPTVFIKRLDAQDAPKKDETFDLKAKQTQGDWAGWFAGNVRMREPGEYELRIPIPGTNESLTQRLTVRKPNPELDNVRNNFGLLYQLASEAKEVLAPLPAETRRKITGLLEPVLEEGARDAKATPRLFFRLDQASAINDCLRTLAPKREQVKGKLYDLWDFGASSGWNANSYHLAWATPIVVGLFGTLVLLIFRQHLFAGLFMGAGVVMAFIPVIYDLAASPNWPDLPLNLSYVLAAIVTLLGIEWLVRKLLKLA